MTRGTVAARRRPKASRAAALGLILASLLVLQGDGIAQGAAPAGIDPLEILNLAVKPNVLVVLDSSRSMRQPPNDPSPSFDPGIGGDWTGSKMHQAKSVLREVIADNENNVSFLFGQYKQESTQMMATGRSGATGPGDSRFFYATTDAAATAVTRSSTADTSNLGLQAWQDIRSGWNKLYFTEYPDVATVEPSVTIGPQPDGSMRNKLHYAFKTAGLTDTADFQMYNCTVTLPSSLYGAHTGDTALADLATAINALTDAVTPTAQRVCKEILGFMPERTNLILDKLYSLTSATPINPSLRLAWDSSAKRFSVQAFNANNTLRLYQLLGPQEDASISGLLGFTTSVPNDVPLAGGGGGLNVSGAGQLGTAGHWTTAAVFGVPLNVGPGALAPIECEVTLTPGFYKALGPAATAGTLANEIQNGMNACAGIGQTYAVTALNATGQLTFAGSLGRNFKIKWSAGPNNVAGALGLGGAADTPVGAGTTPGDTSLRFRTAKAPGLARSIPSVTVGVNTVPVDRFPNADAGLTVSVLRTGRFFNGQVLKVDTTGTVCGLGNDPASSPAATNPPKVYVDYVASCADSSGTRVTFDWAGGHFSGNSGPCVGLGLRERLTPCDNSAGQPQLTKLGKYFDNELPLTANGLQVANYVESSDGSYRATQVPVVGPDSPVVADGATPISRTIADIRTLFNELYNSGQASPAIAPIKDHAEPHEKTILLFVTDGDDTCALAPGNDAFELDLNALATAYQAELLYRPLATSGGGAVSGTGVGASGALAADADPGSSVATYIVGFGSGASVTRLNWIAWGGSGLGQTAGVTHDDAGTRWSSTPAQIQEARASCTACSDAYIAPDAETLRSVLQQIIEQGASSGTFTAQQTVTASVFELAGLVGLDPMDPDERYDAFVPATFQAAFTLPGFKGVVGAYTSTLDADGVVQPVLQWEAGAKLLALVQSGMNPIPLANMQPAVAGQGRFRDLYADGNAAATYGIKRRIYTTSRNGNFYEGESDVVGSLMSGTSPERVSLWPPDTDVTPVVAPTDNATEGKLDLALGLPAIDAANAAAVFASLQSEFRACKGTPLTGAAVDCASADAEVKARRARREAREMILANLAGAAFLPDSLGNPTRVTGSAAPGEILYKAKSSVLAESTLAPPAVLGPPLAEKPSIHGAEYRIYRDGPRTPEGLAVNGVLQGFGLRSPDADGTEGNGVRPTLKPAMSILLVGANDMLHAFRAGPCTTCSPAETGGEELWGFVPFDRLHVMKELLQGQTRRTKTYVIASGIRFGDVFVPGSLPDNFGAASLEGNAGVWRTLVVFGRGAGGKYLTALDVTNRGPFTSKALESKAPIVLWNRGNPDTRSGRADGTDYNRDLIDFNAYKKMGETWSLPALASVDPANYGGIESVVFVGSGYSTSASEGTTFFTLDALTGNVFAAADVGSRTVVAAPGVPSWPNALVAAPSVYSVNQLVAGQSGHPAERAQRVYIGDLHGRIWKFLTTQPGTPLLLADLGPSQPIGTAVALVALPATDASAARPYVYATAGNDSRAAPPFVLVGIKDGGSNTDASVGADTPHTGATGGTVTTRHPAEYLFSQDLSPVGEPGFRGTVQPGTALQGGGEAVAFFLGTRFNPLSQSRCRSSFDSILYALKAEAGGAAYDLSSGGDAEDAYVLLRGSRKTALQFTQARSGDSVVAQLRLDEGIVDTSGPVPPPPPPGQQPAASPIWPSVGYAKPGGGLPPFPQMSTPRCTE